MIGQKNTYKPPNRNKPVNTLLVPPLIRRRQIVGIGINTIDISMNRVTIA